MTRQLAELHLPFPVAYVLLKPEYEVLFLPCLAQMAGKPLSGGRPGLNADTAWDGAGWEARRGIKEWLSKHIRRGRGIKKPRISSRSRG
jgi:hypothetical protein